MFIPQNSLYQTVLHHAASYHTFYMSLVVAFTTTVPCSRNSSLYHLTPRCNHAMLTMLCHAALYFTTLNCTAVKQVLTPVLAYCCYFWCIRPYHYTNVDLSCTTLAHTTISDILVHFSVPASHACHLPLVLLLLPMIWLVLQSLWIWRNDADIWCILSQGACWCIAVAERQLAHDDVSYLAHQVAS